MAAPSAPAIHPSRHLTETPSWQNNTPNIQDTNPTFPNQE
jgi:hypothetical protein